jgi:glycerol kinase
VEHAQILPRPGWVEHDPLEILQNTLAVCRQVAGAGDVVALGFTNQRETVVFWNRETGEPYGNAIVWQDTRTMELCDRLAREGGRDRLRETTGLPLATYFAGPKVAWALEHVPEVASAARKGQLLVGTIDSWLIWNLTGGPEGGRHLTDVTNASRTLLMDLRRLEWDDEILALLGIPRDALPEIVPSCDTAGWGTTAPGAPFAGPVPIRGAVGDQQGALVGQGCTAPGDVKCTYGTGCFALQNTGTEIRASRRGLLSTVAYQLPGQPAVYALEGSVAVAGSLVQWLRDEIGILESAAQIEDLARSVEDSGGIVVVPAFSGLFAPRWRADARGVICGLTRQTSRGHLARAALEAVCHQARDVLDAMRDDSGLHLTELRVDGGMVANDLLMQLQADLLGIPIVRPDVLETTALGAAYLAGLATGFYPEPSEYRAQRPRGSGWQPALDSGTRERMRSDWERAVERSLGWVEASE